MDLEKPRALGRHASLLARWDDLIKVVLTVAAVLMVAACAIIYARIVANTVTIRHLQDFNVFYQSALAFRSGGAPVDVAVTREPGVPRHANLNPPHFTAVMLPFTLLSPTRAFAAWLVVSAAALAASLILIAGHLRLRGWTTALMIVLVFLSPAMAATLMTGQVGLLLLLPFTLGWFEARRGRDGRAGALIGLGASIKPFLLLFVIYFALVERWRAARAATMTVIGLFALSLLGFGLQTHADWIRRLASVTWAEHYMNASLLGLVERSLSTSEWQQVPVADVSWLVAPVWAVIAGGMVFVFLRRVRQLPGLDWQFLLTILTALLVSPLGWVYYLWFLVPPLAATLASRNPLRASPNTVLLAAGLIALLVPPFIPWMALGWKSGLGTVTVGSIYGWGLIALWISAISATEHQQTS